MHVRQIGDPHGKKVAAVLEAMLEKTRAGKMPSLIFITEEAGRQPRYGMVGRIRSDPAKVIGHLAVMKRKMIDLAADEAPDLTDN